MDKWSFFFLCIGCMALALLGLFALFVIVVILAVPLWGAIYLIGEIIRSVL